MVYGSPRNPILTSVCISLEIVFFSAIPQISSIPGTSSSHRLESYPRHSLWGSCSSAKLQSVYSTDPADWAKFDQSPVSATIHLYWHSKILEDFPFYFIRKIRFQYANNNTFFVNVYVSIAIRKCVICAEMYQLVNLFKMPAQWILIHDGVAFEYYPSH